MSEPYNLPKDYEDRIAAMRSVLAVLITEAKSLKVPAEYSLEHEIDEMLTSLEVADEALEKAQNEIDDPCEWTINKWSDDQAMEYGCRKYHEMVDEGRR